MINQNKLSKYECITTLTKKEEKTEETKEKAYADYLVELEQFNPTYYNDKELEKFIY